MKVVSLDHLVLTVVDINKTVEFYQLLGMEKIIFANGRLALKFGSQKINLHQRGKEFEPKALTPASGSADLCFIIDKNNSDELIGCLEKYNIRIEEGPVNRTGANGAISSVYIRDPDGNLIELSYYI